MPRDTPILPGGVEYFPPPGAGPYAFRGFIFNGEYAILTRNPNYGGSRPQRLDAIGFREGIDTAKAVARVQRGSWDAVEHFDPLACAGRNRRASLRRRAAGSASRIGRFHAL